MRMCEVKVVDLMRLRIGVVGSFESLSRGQASLAWRHPSSAQGDYPALRVTENSIGNPTVLVLCNLGLFV